jgi:flagellar assembly protein FliH
MPRPVTLEFFEAVQPTATEVDTVVLTAEALEEARLAAYEEGYKAGWDDAVAAAEEEGQSQRREIARQLQELSFTYHEARSHLREGLAPLFDEICARLLPEAARAALGGLVREALMPLADAALDRPLRLLVHPAARKAIEAALEGLVAPPFEIVEEASLTPGQVYLRRGAEERRIDVDAATRAIATVVAEHFAIPEPSAEEPMKAHG